MTVTSVEPNFEDATLTVTIDLDAPPEAVWDLIADPRKLERWWGPPSHPATFERHELTPGGVATHFMTAPDGERFHGVWRVVSVDAPRALHVEDSFATPDGVVDPNLPATRMRVSITEAAGQTRLEITSTSASKEDLEKLLEMGAAEGMRQAFGQMDALLAE